MSWKWSLTFLLLLSGCTKTQAPAPEAPAAPAPIADVRAPAPQIRPLVMPVCKSQGLDSLSAARNYLDEDRNEEALSCAAQWCAENPNDAQGHSERGAALSALGRYDEAQMAYARALALDPDHLDALMGAAQLYVVLLANSRERDELGAVYAEHGLQVAQDAKDKKSIAEFARLAAMAYNDLGQAKDALERAELARSLEPDNREALFERAVALFELCRFPEAKAAFSTMLDDPDRRAHAHRHLALILEREGKLKEADKHFAKAHDYAPEDFPEPQLLPQDVFRAELAKAVKALPEDMQKDLAGIPVTAEEIPKDEDLLSGDPPLSPGIIGLFRGPPLGEACTPEEGTPCRSVVLYRKNLARAVRSHDELIEQIRVTLLHEVGHLRGEDDYELAARGLE